MYFQGVKGLPRAFAHCLAHAFSFKKLSVVGVNCVFHARIFGHPWLNWGFLWERRKELGKVRVPWTNKREPPTVQLYSYHAGWQINTNDLWKNFSAFENLCYKHTVMVADKYISEGLFSICNCLQIGLWSLKKRNYQKLWNSIQPFSSQFYIRLFQIPALKLSQLREKFHTKKATSLDSRHPLGLSQHRVCERPCLVRKPNSRLVV